MRGPNKGGNIPGAGGSTHQRTSSSPAATASVGLGQVSVHISGGQGLSPPEMATPFPQLPHSSRRTVSGNNANGNRPAQPSPLTLSIPLPPHRTIHVAHSFPDLHGEARADSAITDSPLSAAESAYALANNFQQQQQQQHSRPRSHTTPHPLPTTALPLHIQHALIQQQQQQQHPAHHLFQGFRQHDLSPSEPSEPHSATSSNFSFDMYNMYPSSLPPPSVPGPGPLPVSMRMPAQHMEYVQVAGNNNAFQPTLSSSSLSAWNASPIHHVSSGRGSGDTIQPDEVQGAVKAHLGNETGEGEGSWSDSSAPLGWNGAAQPRGQQAGFHHTSNTSSSSTPSALGYGLQHSNTTTWTNPTPAP